MAKNNRCVGRGFFRGSVPYLPFILAAAMAAQSAFALRSETRLKDGPSLQSEQTQQKRTPSSGQMKAAAKGGKAGARVDWHSRLGTPASVRGVDLRQPAVFGGGKGLAGRGSKTNREQAIAVLDNLSSVFRVKDAEKEFKAGKAQSDSLGFTHVRVKQMHEGLDVVGGGLIVHFDKDGNAYEVNGQYVPDIDVDVVPGIGAADAGRMAFQDLVALGKPAGSIEKAPELVVYARGAAPRLAYALTIVYADTGSGAGRWRYWIDASNGAVLLRYNDIHDIAPPTSNGGPSTITGNVLAGEGGGSRSVVGWRENTGIYYLHSAGLRWQVYNVASSGYADNGTYAFRYNNAWGSSDPAEMSLGVGFDAVQAYFMNVHGRNSFDDAGALARANVHLGINYVNAYWNGYDFSFGDGDNVTATALGVLDVAGHEFTHAVTEYSANLTYAYESGALNESFSDIFGACVEFYGQPDGRGAYPGVSRGRSDWLLGEDCWLSSTALRDMRNPANAATVGAGNEQPTRYLGNFWYSGPMDNGGVHQNSGVQNFFFYLLCEGGTGNNEGINYNVTGIGIANAEKVAYRALTVYFTSDTDHQGARLAWVSAAMDLDPTWVPSVSAAWRAVGVNAPRAELSLDRLAYRSDATVSVSVDDGDGLPPSVDVAVRCYSSDFVSIANPGTLMASNTVVLAIQGFGPLFTNTFSIAGLLEPDPEHGDMLVFTYMDNDFLTGAPVAIVTNAPVDDVPPVISAIHVEDVSDTSAYIVWTTDEPSSEHARCATSVPMTDPWQGSDAIVGWGRPGPVAHRVRVTGLTQRTVYYSSVRSEDAAGNVSTVPANTASADPADYPKFSTLWARSVLVDDMEDGVRRWQPGGIGTQWEYGVPTYGPPSAYSGLNCWGTALAGNYDYVTQSWLESEPIRVGSLPRLRFRHWYSMGLGNPFGVPYDFCVVQVDGGAGWINLPNEATGQTNYIGASAGWEMAEYDLSRFADRVIRIRFRLEAVPYSGGWSDIGPGWYVDDVELTEIIKPGVWVFDFDRPFDDATANNPEVNDGDGYPEAGETVNLKFIVYNVDAAARSNLSAIVALPSQYTKLVGPTNVLSYGAMNIGDSRTSAPPIAVSITNVIPPKGAEAPVLHTMMDRDHNSWLSSLTLQIGSYDSATGMVRNTLGTGIAGATVTAVTTGQFPTVYATTDVTGRYVMNGMARGRTYMVKASKSGEYLDSATRPVLAPANNIDFVLKRAFAVAAPVSIATNMVGGQVLNFGLTVSNTGPAPVDTNLVFEAVTYSYSPDLGIAVSSGTNRVTVIPGATTNLQISITMSSSALPGAFSGGIVLDGEYVGGTVVIPVMITMDSAEISGTVRDTYGVAITSALVRASHPLLPEMSALTFDDGTYSIVGVAPGASYSVMAVKAGEYSPSTNVTVVPDAAGVDFTLGRAYAVHDTNALVIATGTNVLIITVEPGGAASNATLLVRNTAVTNPPTINLQAAVSAAVPVDRLTVSVTPTNITTAPFGSSAVTVTAKAGAVQTGVYYGYVSVDGNQVGADPLMVALQVNVVGANIPFIEFVSAKTLDQDGDGYLEPNETAGLSMRVKNTGYGTAYGLRGTVSTPSALASVTQPVAVYPAFVMPGAQADSVVNAQIQISPAAVEGDVIPFKVVFEETPAGGAWSNTFDLTVGISPDLSLSPASFNVTVDEGREAFRTLVVSNASAKTLDVKLGTQLEQGFVTPPAPVVAPVNWSALTEKEADLGTLLVGYRDGIAGAASVARTAAAAGARELRRFRAVPVTVLGVGRGSSLAETAARLQADPNVLYVEPNYRVYKDEVLSASRVEPNDTWYEYGYMWGMDNFGQSSGTAGADIDAPEAWAISRGCSNVIVAVIDTGVDYNHDDLAGNMWVNPGESGLDAWGRDKASNGRDDDGNGYVDDVHGADFSMLPYGGVTGDPMDTDGHGTHVAGTIGAVGSNGVGVAGVCWNVKVMGLKFIGDYGGSLDAAMAAIEYAMDKGVKIANNSWGGGGFSISMYNLLEQAKTNGLLMVCAAGNSGTDNDAIPHYPSSYPNENIIAVAATDRDDLLASFSCYGNKSVDIAAPGVEILSTYPSWSYGGSYAFLDGTSMATPHVTGVGALLMAMAPKASWSVLKSAIISSAIPDPSLEGRMTTGGHLSAYRAARMMQAHWLKLSEEAFSLAVGQKKNVTVTFNYRGLARPGTHKAQITADVGCGGTNSVSVIMNVVPAPSPAVEGVRVDDSVVGDRDGYAEPGETVNLYIQLINRGTGYLDPVTGHVATAAAGVTILQHPRWTDGAASQETVEPSTPLRVAFSGAAPTNVVFRMNVSEGFKGPWTGLVFSVSIGGVQSITGRVYDAVSGIGVADATVEYVGPAAGSLLTSANGGYRILGLKPGSYQVRARAASFAVTDFNAAPVAGSDVRLDFSMMRPSGRVLPTAVTGSVLVGMSTNITVELANEGSAPWVSRIRELKPTKVALLSDVMQLTGIEGTVRAMGVRCDLLENNLVHAHSLNGTLLAQYGLVVADLSGAESTGRKILDDEVLVLDAYVRAGGVLLLTGPNLLGSPDNVNLSAMVGSTRTGVQQALATKGVTGSVPDPLLQGPYAALNAGDQVVVSGQRYDDARPDTNLAAVALLKTGEASKIMRRRMGNGSVVLWTGNRDGAEWRNPGVLRDLFRNAVLDALTTDISWLSVGAASPVSVPPIGGVFVPITMTAPPKIVDVMNVRATVLFVGALPSGQDVPLQVSFLVWPPAVTVEASDGVVDWLGRSLRGDGGSDSCMYQVLSAGTNGAADAPNDDGSAGGDDKVLVTLADGLPFGRFGHGYELEPDFGRFRQTFDMQGMEKGTKVYVRAWDASSVAAAVVYGDSPLYSTAFTVAEASDFVRWVVNRVPGYPGRSLGEMRDWDYDSVPDGYMVRFGYEVRDPIGPLPNSWSPVRVVGDPDPPSIFSRPGRVAIYSNLVFVADTANYQIQVWNRALTTLVNKFGSNGSASNQFISPQGLAFDAKRRELVVADTGNHRISIFRLTDYATAKVAFRTQIGGSRGSGANQFWSPYAVAVFKNNGWIMVADRDNNRVQIHRPSGAGYVLNASVGGLDRPQGVGVDSSGLMYAVDTFRNRIGCYSMSGGAELWGFDGGTNHFVLPSDIQFGVSNRAYVADSGAHRIQVFDMRTYGTAKLLGSFGSMGSLAGQLRVPQGAVPAPDDNLVYVADTRNERVQLMRVIIDSDRDGMDDVWEDLNGLNSSDPNDWDDDPDGDGLLNIGEYRIRTNPMEADTNNNGVDDGDEAAMGFHAVDSGMGLLAIRDVGGVPDILNWNAVSGGIYQIQFTRDMINVPWSNGPSVTVHADGVFVWTNTIPRSEPNQFFRVLRLNP